MAALGAPLVGIIAERFFRFPAGASTYICEGGQPVDQGVDVHDMQNKAHSLGNAMLTCMIIPWALCLSVYTALHFTYPQDKQRAIEVANYIQQPQSMRDESPPFVPQSVPSGVPTQPTLEQC